MSTRFRFHLPIKQKHSVCLLLLTTWLSACQPPPEEIISWCYGTTDDLEIACQDPYCVAAVIVDYKRVEPRGFRIFSLSGTPLEDRAQAEEKALSHIAQNLNQPKPDQVDCDRSENFFNCWLTYQNNLDNWLVIIHISSGAVLFAGREIWANPDRNHDYPLDSGYQSNSALHCTKGAADPQSKTFITTGIPEGSPVASEPLQAWEVAKRLNVTEEVTRNKPYQVMVIGFSPAIGEFDPQAADWLVWVNPLP